MTDAFITIDRDWRITYANRQAARINGKPAETFVGRMLWEEWPSAIGSAIEQEYRRALADQTPVQFEHHYVSDRHDLWLDIRAYPSAAGLDVFFRDITDRKRTEAAMRHKRQSLKMVTDTAVRMLMDDHPEKPMEELFDRVAGHLRLDTYLNYLANGDGRLRLNASAGVPEEVARSITFLDMGQAICGMVAREQQRCVVEDVQCSLHPGVELIRSLGLTAYVCHPMVAHGRLIGTLSFGSRTRAKFEEDELEVLRAVCDQLAMALERKRLIDELQQRAAELAYANAAKEQFLAVLSHELRTPLTPVVMAVAAMETEPTLSPELRDDLAMIRRNIDLEIRLIDDLLDLSRITSGKLSLNTREVHLRPLLSAVADMLASDLRGKRLTLAWDLQAEHDKIKADPARLQQVLWNLLKNSVKFTPEGGTITIRTHNPVAAKLVVDVQDTGKGIEPELLPRVFSAFEQGQHATMRQFGGLGLGLAISKAIVEMHGGTISAHSDGREQGATFTIELPTTGVAAELLDRLMSAAGVAGADRAGKPTWRVLLVEDHPDTQRIMRRLLESAGYVVTTAGSVAAATKLVEAHRFDVLVSDLGLPDGTGLDLMRHIRDRNVPMPAIAVTGYGMEHDVRTCFEAGFTTHLTKPINLDRLKAELRRLVLNERMARE